MNSIFDIHPISMVVQGSKKSALSSYSWLPLNRFEHFLSFKGLSSKISPFQIINMYIIKFKNLKNTITYQTIVFFKIWNFFTWGCNKIFVLPLLSTSSSRPEISYTSSSRDEGGVCSSKDSSWYITWKKAIWIFNKLFF